MHTIGLISMGLLLDYCLPSASSPICWLATNISCVTCFIVD